MINKGPESFTFTGGGGGVQKPMKEGILGLKVTLNEVEILFSVSISGAGQSGL